MLVVVFHSLMMFRLRDGNYAEPYCGAHGARGARGLTRRRVGGLGHCGAVDIGIFWTICPLLHILML